MRLTVEKEEFDPHLVYTHHSAEIHLAWRGIEDERVVCFRSSMAKVLEDVRPYVAGQGR